MTAPLASPDLPIPVNLTLHAVNENDMVDAMVASLHVNLPAWVEQEGATEVLLFESLALVIGQQVFALNQLPRVVLDGLIAIRGYIRKPAFAAAGQLMVTLAASTLGTRTLPVGARFRVPLETGGTFDMLAAETTMLNPSDGLVSAVNVIADIPGTTPNGTPIGTPVSMVDAYTWIESAVVGTVLGGGGNTESDAVFYARVAAAFQSLSATLVIDQQFATAALAVAGVGRAKGYGLWDGVGPLGTVTGHVTVAVAGPDGADVSAAVKATVLAVLIAGSVAGLTVHVINFFRVSMNLTIVYTPVAGATAADVTVGIEAVLRGWLNPVTWPFTESLTSVNQIILRIGQVVGVDNVISVTGWSTVTGGATLPSLGTVSISTA